MFFILLDLYAFYLEIDEPASKIEGRQDDSMLLWWWTDAD